jgi:MinD-like ATPase involved in chromosome partitioning or flagellar assembly
MTLPLLPDDPAAEAIAVLRFLEQLRSTRERIVVDADGGGGSASVAAVLAADVLIVASRDEGAALLDSYAAIKWFARLGYGGRVGVVIGGSPGRGAETAGRRLAGAAARFLGLEVQALGTFSDADAWLSGGGAAACGEAAGGDAELSRIAVRLDPDLWPGPLGSDVWLNVAHLFL